jgi:tRNA (mo5U34)-methyltransferase
MDLKAEVKKHFWWHTIDLGNGVETEGAKSAELMKREADLLFSDINLLGKTVLDVGAWNGGFSVEALRRGASRVAGLDHTTWNSTELRGRETFDLVSQAVGNRLEAIDENLDRPALCLKHLGSFDVVLFSGVFYHLFDPIAATRELSSLAKEILVVETHIENTLDPRPSMVFYPGSELNGDGSNWWGPNIACMVALLKQFGFSRINVTEGSSCTRAVFHAFR